MTPFEVGIWQAAFATAREDHAAHAAEMLEEFRLLVAEGDAGLPVTEGNVCDHKNLINEHGGNCILCGIPMGSP